MSEQNIQLLFPTPVMFDNINRKFTDQELSFIKSHSSSDKINRNIGNVTSSNNYILNKPEMKDLNKFITEQLNKYIKQVYKPKYLAEAFITQSWINWTKKGEFHHKHEHPNSFISGVLYISADFTKDTITFYRSVYNQLQLTTNTFDVMNSDAWHFNIKNGDIIMFPSSLTHSVESVISDEVRISIAFNSFIKGTLGENKDLTELLIKKESL